MADKNGDVREMGGKERAVTLFKLDLIKLRSVTEIRDTCNVPIGYCLSVLFTERTKVLGVCINGLALAK